MRTKSIITVLLVFFTISAYSGKTRLKYLVKKDTLSKLVPEGKTRVHGTVLFQGKPVANARVSTIDHKRSTTTDKEGKYSFLILSSDTSLYVYKPGKEEVVINSYGFKSKHAVEIEFYLSYAPVRPMRKPVVYLYSEKEEEVSIKLNIKGEMTFTYPEYDNGWIVKTISNGCIKHNKKTYPYLFWEGESKTLDYMKKGDSMVEGFIVNSNSITSFFESSLDQMGLNQNEKTDFITFWAPQIQKKSGDYFIQFLFEENYKNYVAELEIKPKPKSIRRVYMLYSFIDSQQDYFMPYTEQKIKAFVREGFTYVEWGGTEIESFPKIF